MKRAIHALVAYLALAGGVSEVEAQTVVILVRHAERVDESHDSDLSDAGVSRAKALAAMLKDAGIEAIYSTQTRRTLGTAKPTAEAIVKLVEIYDGDKLPELAKDLRAGGRRALVVGHSDSTPELVALLGGEAGSPIEVDEYDRIYVLTLPKDGKTSTTLLRFPSGVKP